ncbi:MAG: L,D-transpeptidase family protein [Lachnospiraceae bacterium]|nr:L,D-transpeptidase family protein [Lachnospiraceae bacterium]
MGQRLIKLLRRIFLVFLLICLGGYLAIVYFYKDVFMVNTWINGIYCTGKTVEEVNTELLLQTKAPFITIISPNGDREVINMTGMSYHVDYEESLRAQKKNQNVWKWPLYVLKRKDIQILPVQTWNEEALKQQVRDLKLVQKEVPESLQVKIVMGEQGYELFDNLYQVLQPELLAEYVNTSFKNGEYTVEMTKSGAYLDIEPTPEQEETRKLWDKLQKFLDCGIIYDMGDEQIALTKEKTSYFVLLDGSGNFWMDEKGNFQVDTKGIEAFVDELAAEYNTCDSTLTFNATRGETVTVQYITYGTEIDTNAEKEYLKNAFAGRVKEVHIPAYHQEGYVRGKNDIGNTYIEVDMGNQKLYAYKEGELLLETDIVTGNMKRKWNTPEGINFVYAKQKKRVLRGPGYATPVDYWMPVKGSIGLHDADWRKEFGGDIYLTNGSHGCVNIPPEIMPTIYEEYEIGTPVIMFY